MPRSLPPPRCSWVPETLPYLEYAPLYDLIFLVLLAFGMLMVMTGEVQHALEAANADLAQNPGSAGERWRSSITSRPRSIAIPSIPSSRNPRGTDRSAVRGCAAFADIDNMKVINDQHGHTAGDYAIRAVATAIRACIRADDLLFRWGGDEFLVLLIGVSESGARARLDNLDQRLKHTVIPGLPEPVDVQVSVGYAAFDSASSLDEVIALADSAMYGGSAKASSTPPTL